MPEVLVANDELTVLGGPSSINVNVDLGATGKRGSQIFISPGDPTDPLTVIGQTPEVFDLCINTLTSDEEYLYLYQYQNLGALNSWVPLFKIIPNTYSQNYTKGFVDGEAQINIPVALITESQNLTATNFNIQINIINDNPVSASSTIETIQIVDGSQVLPISIKAVEYADSSWSDLSGTKIVHVFITVV
jgi:hypothetical protein